MSFNVLEWLISKSLDLSAAKSFAALNNMQLRLNKVVDEWARKLPVSASLISIAMYLDTQTNNQKNRALSIFCKELESGRLPTCEILLNALREKWLECKENGASQPFFLIDEETAISYITSLASAIHAILVQEKELFYSFVHAQLLHLRNENRQIRETLQKLEELIRRNELSTIQTKKIFRPIPDCRVPILDENEMRKALFKILFSISLFKTFQGVKYHKFTCLMAYSRDAFFMNDDDMSGLCLYTGEIAFLSNLRNLVDMFLKDSQTFSETLDAYYDDSDFKEFKLKYELLCTEGLFAYEIEIDGHAKRYSILKKVSAGEIDYNRMSSLNSSLQVMPAMTVPSLFVIDFDKISTSLSMTKFIYCCILEDKVDLGKLRVNVDDFDDWDFDYILASKSN